MTAAQLKLVAQDASIFQPFTRINCSGDSGYLGQQLKRQTLVLRPLNGLCNRMRALASARALAIKADVNLVVFWEVNKDLYARYDELFVHDRSFSVRNVDPSKSIGDTLSFLLYSEVKRFKGFPASWITKLHFRNRILRNLRPEDMADHELEAMFGRTRKTLISSWWQFYGGDEVDYSFFVPRESEHRHIEDTASNFDSHTVGVHIRRGDNINSFKYSPTKAFLKAMEQCLYEDSQANFFLATDCPVTNDVIQSEFSGQVYTRSRNVERTSLQGMKDAVIDLFLLSKTSRILGSYYSAFSETAADLGNISWVTVTDDPGLIDKCNSNVLLV